MHSLDFTACSVICIKYHNTVNANLDIIYSDACCFKYGVLYIGLVKNNNTFLSPSLDVYNYFYRINMSLKHYRFYFTVRYILLTCKSDDKQARCHI